MKINVSEIMRLNGRLSDIETELASVFVKISNELTAISNNIKTSILIESNRNVIEKMENLSFTINHNLDKLIEFLTTQLNSYTVTNEEATASLEHLIEQITNVFDSSGTVIMSTKTETIMSGTTTVSEAAPSLADSIDISVYKDNPEMGFVVSTGHPVYELTDSERHFMYSIVAAEAINDYDDALAVSSVILNRADANNMTPEAIMTRKNQFEAYGGGSGPYLKYQNGSKEIPEAVKRAVDDALNGVRNCGYFSFNANSNTGYSDIQVVDGGNRFK